MIEGRVFLLLERTGAKGICRSFSHDQMDSVRLRLKLDRVRRDRLLHSSLSLSPFVRSFSIYIFPLWWFFLTAAHKR